VRVNASVSGIPAGERCRLIVVSRTGEWESAASWLVSPDGEQTGTNLDGAALIAPEDVTAVEVHTVDGRRLVSTMV
jgi:hypothetical protein